ncbi:GreA/GreB family elongation factor [Turicibacter sanguinis]|uniref:GreA/GreB family elongation factor n=1 Tax=Turicibacter sanguinis TaxID=154288 RepID=UPI0018A8A751|nr:GreA/GreB family elongation factor [Turicibacter sanguinis]MDB8563349.1 GreA/GreB family elongation factor [Turicibacter sanguinis]
MSKRKKKKYGSGFNSYVINKGLVNEYGKQISSTNQFIKKYNGVYTNGMIRLGSRVILKNIGTQIIETYDIVTTDKADIFNNKISEESNLGKILLGKTKGSRIKLPSSKGITEYEIIEII